MAELLASLDDLLARLDWELSDVEKRVAESALEDLSDSARYYASASSWTSLTVPRAVRTIVLRAAVRYMRNPDGYVQSRAGDEVVGWAPSKVAGAPQFTEQEQEEIRDLGRRGSSLSVVGTYVYMAPGAPTRDCRHVPVHYHGKGFPFL